MPTTQLQLVMYRLGAIFCLMAVLCLTGCVEEQGDEDVVADVWSEELEQHDIFNSLSSGRTLSEELLAGELEGLLPGEWARTEVASNPALDLNIIFLGHAVTGDIALLVSATNSELVIPTQVLLDDEQALLYMPKLKRSYHIEHIDADSLSLVEPETGERFVYRRSR